MLRCLAIALAVATTLGAGDARAGALRLAPVAEGATALVSDGHRYVAVETADRTTVVLDDVTGERRSVTPPGACRDGLRAVGGGQVLWSCLGDPRAALFDLASGELRSLPIPDGLATVEDPASPGNLYGVSREWISGRGTPNPEGKETGRPYFWRWLTGEVRMQPAEVNSELGHLADRRAFASLEHPRLARPLCRGLRPLQGRRGAVRGVRGRRAIRSLRRGGFAVETCSGRSRTFTDCHSRADQYDCSLPVVGRQLFTWHEGKRIHTVALRGLTRHASARLDRRPLALAPVRGAVYALLDARAGRPAAIYRARPVRRSAACCAGLRGRACAHRGCRGRSGSRPARLLPGRTSAARGCRTQRPRRVAS